MERNLEELARQRDHIQNQLHDESTRAANSDCELKDVKEKRDELIAKYKCAEAEKAKLAKEKTDLEADNEDKRQT